VGLFDAISGIFSAGLDFVTDFGGGAFAAVDERLRGGRLSSGEAAGLGRRAGATIGNLFGDISTSFITSQLPTGRRPQQTSAGRQLGGGATIAEVIRESGAPGGGIIGLAQTPFGFPQLPEIVRRQRPLPERRIPQEASLGGTLLDIGIGLATGLIGERLLEGTREPRGGRIGISLEGEMADRLPGGAVIPGGGGVISAEAARPLAGRVFNTTQNLNTGAISLRARPLLMFQNPMTGNPVWYKNMGRPILWAGDIACAKRVAKIASRVGRRRPR